MPVGHAEIDTRAQRSRRRRRIRKKIRGTVERPRLAVFRSNKHIYAQLIDDVRGHTLAAASSQELDRKGSTKNVEASKEVGTLLAQKAQEAGIEVPHSRRLTIGSAHVTSCVKHRGVTSHG